MTGRVTISVDAMGGDNAPRVVLDGVASALAENANISVILCGPADIVEPFAAQHKNCIAQPTTQVVEMGEHPAQAVRSKKDSSLVVGCRMVKEGRAQGFFSAGSTGACLAAGTLIIGRIKGVQRPSLTTIIPSPIRPVVMGDVGANADCKPEYLVQFAQMAIIYAEKILNIKNPRVALLNIGEEETKGSQFALEAYDLLKERIPNFKGNAEGNDIVEANFDVIVTDGFTGNVCLKTIEGTSKVLFSSIKGIMKSSPLTMLGALTLKGGFKKLADSISSETYGGAPLLGVKGACIVGHGSSNARAVKNGILTAAKFVDEDVSELIAQSVSEELTSATM